VKAIYLQWNEVASVLFSVSLLLFLVLRTVRIARSRAAMATDLHAVHSVQEILLARASAPTPGFRVEHVYHPALEVGGDFFLVSPGPDGSITAIVGDVSGKGLVAAMRVSMILGVLRREEHREPATILANLNDALRMQGEMGFTTACCVRLHRDGRYTIANAGHINPYVNGEEIPTPNSLPLGLVGDQKYEQISGLLPEGKTLVLMSDGVVEARSAQGELYGFDRLPQLTMMSAGDIADVARRFGQEDDITVLTVACGA
jgi:serine phosphatase RsbU (regulator of sigma subunit)